MSVPGYRYWRISFSRTRGGSSATLCVGYIKFRNVDFDTEGLTLSAKAGTSPAANAFNNLHEPYWLDTSGVAPGDPTWVMWDAGVGNVWRPGTSMQIGNRPSSYGSSDNDPEDFQLQYSSDNVVWQNHLMVSGEIWSGSDEEKTYSFDPIAEFSVKGRIYDRNGVLTSRQVRLYRREDWEFMGMVSSNGTTGEYSFTLLDDDECDLIVRSTDDASPLHNDIIRRTIPKLIEV